VRIGGATNIQVIPGIVAASPGRPRGVSGHSSGPSAGKIGMRAEPPPRLSELPSPWRSCCSLRVRPRWSQGEAPRLPSRVERSEELHPAPVETSRQWHRGGNPAGHRGGRRRTCVVDVDSAYLHQCPLPGETARSRWHGASLRAHALPRSHASFARRSPCRVAPNAVQSVDRTDGSAKDKTSTTGDLWPTCVDRARLICGLPFCCWISGRQAISPVKHC
jgi:hypothetical protein